MLKSKIKRYLPTALAVLFAAFVFIISFIWFKDNTTNIINELAKDSLDEETINILTDNISAYTIIVESFLAFAFLMILFPIVNIVKSNLKISKSNERYKLVTTQTQAVIFEYDFPKRRLELSGNYETVFGNNDSFVADRALDVLDIIHPDESSVKDEIKNLSRNNISALSGEIRLKCMDDKYYWFRLKGTVVRDDAGKALKLVGNILNVDDSASKEHRLKQSLELDELTGLLNKDTLEKNVDEYLKNALDEDLCALYIINLDNFKYINDVLGHAAGDKILMDVAKKMCLVFTDNDCVARKSGDEFAVFLKLSPEARKIGMKIVENKAKSICAKLNETYSDDKNEAKISASVGIAIYPSDGSNFSELYRRADAALYAAKNSGKNQYFIFNSEFSL